MIWLIRIIAGFAMLIITGCSTLKEDKILSPSLFNLEEIAPHIYVSDDMTDPVRLKLLKSIKQAKRQVSEIYGSCISVPTIYAFSNHEKFLVFNGMNDGSANGLLGLFGIILVPENVIPETLAHEWSRIELMTRIAPSSQDMVPRWFEEGLAVIASNLPQHSENVWRQIVNDNLPYPGLDELETMEQWVDANTTTEYKNPKGLNIVYTTAGHEVRAWYKYAGQSGLLKLINAMQSGEKFHNIYKSLSTKNYFCNHRKYSRRFISTCLLEMFCACGSFIY